MLQQTLTDEEKWLNQSKGTETGRAQSHMYPILENGSQETNFDPGFLQMNKSARTHKFVPVIKDSALWI
jgi:hypothetical protein